MERKFHTKQETASILGLHVKTIERYLLSGKLKGAKLGKKWKISDDDIHAFYNEIKEETEKLIRKKNEKIKQINL